METTRLLENQNLLDLAIVHFGSVDRIFEILEANNWNSLTQLPSEYKDISIPSSGKYRDAFREIHRGYLAPATLHTEEELEILRRIKNLKIK